MISVSEEPKKVPYAATLLAFGPVGCPSLCAVPDDAAVSPPVLLNHSKHSRIPMLGSLTPMQQLSRSQKSQKLVLCAAALPAWALRAAHQSVHFLTELRPHSHHCSTLLLLLQQPACQTQLRRCIRWIL